MRLQETFTARSHPNIRGTHAKTVEVTKESHVTPRGDCILAVAAEKGLKDLKQELREAARHSDAVIKLTLEAGDQAVEITGKGDPDLTWSHASDMVARMSSYICPRTLMIHADKASTHLPRTFIQLLKNPETVIKLTVSVETPN